MNWKAGDKAVSLRTNILYEINSCNDQKIAIGKILKWADGSSPEKSRPMYISLTHLRPLKMEIKNKSHPLTNIFK